MGWISVINCIIPAYLFYQAGDTLFCTISSINAVIQFWSFGVMHNYAMNPVIGQANQLRKNLELEGLLDKEVEEKLYTLTKNLEADAIPNWLAGINLTSFLIGVGLLILYIVVK